MIALVDFALCVLFKRLPLEKCLPAHQLSSFATIQRLDRSANATRNHSVVLMLRPFDQKAIMPVTTTSADQIS